jgi:hypothetical protein
MLDFSSLGAELKAGLSKTHTTSIKWIKKPNFPKMVYAIFYTTIENTISIKATIINKPTSKGWLI